MNIFVNELGGTHKHFPKLFYMAEIRRKSNQPIDRRDVNKFLTTQAKAT